MRNSLIVAASAVAAVSATTARATTSSYSSSTFSINSKPQYPSPHLQEDGLCKKKRDESASSSSSCEEKFAPRFDGLRFIETLVTAHR